MKITRFSYLALILLVSAALLVVWGCKKDDDDDKKGSEVEKYFSVQNGTLVEKSFPASNTSLTLNDVGINENILAGGSSIVTIDCEESISEIYVGVSGKSGYYKISPDVMKSGAGVYTLLLLISQELSDSFTIIISALTSSGVTQAFTCELHYIQAGTGALQVSLSFNNEKDVDLYVVQPDGDVIYYGNRGDFEYDEEWNVVQIWGLDVDSNANCSIDGINNENIFYPDGYVQAGKYEVWVNMYANCDPDIATDWNITATYHGSLITPSFGVNPATGVFPIGEPSNRIGSSLSGATKVMEFTVSASDASKMAGKKNAPSVLTESAKIKLQQAQTR